MGEHLPGKLNVEMNVTYPGISRNGSGLVETMAGQSIGLADGQLRAAALICFRACMSLYFCWRTQSGLDFPRHKGKLQSNRATQRSLLRSGEVRLDIFPCDLRHLAGPSIGDKLRSVFGRSVCRFFLAGLLLSVYVHKDRLLLIRRSCYNITHGLRVLFLFSRMRGRCCANVRSQWTFIHQSPPPGGSFACRVFTWTGLALDIPVS